MASAFKRAFGIYPAHYDTNIAAAQKWLNLNRNDTDILIANDYYKKAMMDALAHKDLDRANGAAGPWKDLTLRLADLYAHRGTEHGLGKSMYELTSARELAEHLVKRYNFGKEIHNTLKEREERYAPVLQKRVDTRVEKARLTLLENRRKDRAEHVAQYERYIEAGRALYSKGEYILTAEQFGAALDLAVSKRLGKERIQQTEVFLKDEKLVLATKVNAAKKRTATAERKEKENEENRDTKEQEKISGLSAAILEGAQIGNMRFMLRMRGLKSAKTWYEVYDVRVAEAQKFLKVGAVGQAIFQLKAASTAAKDIDSVREGAAASAVMTLSDNEYERLFDAANRLSNSGSDAERKQTLLMGARVAALDSSDPSRSQGVTDMINDPALQEGISAEKARVAELLARKPSYTYGGYTGSSRTTDPFGTNSFREPKYGGSGGWAERPSPFEQRQMYSTDSGGVFAANQRDANRESKMRQQDYDSRSGGG